MTDTPQPIASRLNRYPYPPRSAATVATEEWPAPRASEAYGEPVEVSRPVLGIVGLVSAGLGAVLVCVPNAVLAGWVLLPIAFILGVAGVLRLNSTRWPAVTAMAVAVAGTVGGILVSTVQPGIWPL